MEGSGTGHADVAHRVDVQVGRKLQIRRNQLGLSLADVGEAMDRIAPPQVWKYERGLNRLSASKIWEAAHVLRVGVGYFFHGLREPPEDPDAVARLDRILEAAALVPEVEEIHKLNKQSRQAVGALILALVPKK